VETVRSAFLAAAAATTDLLGRRELGEAWQEPSVLPDFEIGALAGHLARGVLTPYWYLDMPEPDAPAATAAEYVAALTTSDPSAAQNVDIRERGAETSKGGWARLYLDVGKATAALAERLAVEPATHRVPAMGRALLIDEYLKTRIVEMVFHLDDLTRSLSLPAPALPSETVDLAIEVLVAAARVRHGDAAVLHALGRRELDKVDALRVL
jgi:hypothetical protein